MIVQFHLWTMSKLRYYRKSGISEKESTLTIFLYH
uniref:Uncharacterized protein n=1 Tax=Arundo donax TaxID=35708 RepID=A0A0A9H991_ARUDO